MSQLLRKTKDEPKYEPLANVSTNRWWIVLLVMLTSLSLTASEFGPALVAFFVPRDYTLCSRSRDIYTVDENQPRVECIAVRGSWILDAGDQVDIQRRWSEGRQSKLCLPVVHRCLFRGTLNIIHVKPGSIIVPGLADAHAHVLEYGFKMQLQLDGSKSIDEVISRLKSYIEAHPDIRDDSSRWIEGMGWDQTKWPGAQFPTANDFDREPLLRGRPIALVRVDGHASWVSSRVLESMGELPDEVEGGSIVRYANGKPTGVMVDNAISLIPRPPLSESRAREYFDLTMKDALAHGLTSIHDADSSPEALSLFKKLAETGKLPIRLYAMGNVKSDDYWGSKIPRLLHYGKHGRLNVRSVKLYADGALGSWGAALLAPYSDKSETSGFMLSTPQALAALVKQFWKDGWQVNIHCIGDRANKVVLDIFENILEGHGVENLSEWRPRIEHAQILQVRDLERAGRLGVIMSVQPTHATSDMWYAESRLGPERLKDAYAYHTQLQASSSKILPLGSDFPIEGVNPLLGFYAAVSRLSVDGESPHGKGGWYPEQRLTRAQALKGMTLDAAYASFAENELGSLTPGKKADFVILDRDIMTVPFSEILSAKVQATVVDGSVAYGSL
ncbi:hypothetical protein PILCRDRAFT_2295 [Piloderma croceum F 1598]|uniref:Amidohydrolase 3 domain-containing protein n=1 Tax=Piloderma croceum (strain F 1598) TaxID=765440 RepID=A0A0C3BU35_PILCF|nr:hypothetical protein PILCRDRAFT_2295 [Piloderma croceum F 1598]